MHDFIGEVLPHKRYLTVASSSLQEEEYGICMVLLLAQAVGIKRL